MNCSWKDLNYDNLNKLIYYTYGFIRGNVQCYINVDDKIYPIIDRLYLSNIATAANREVLLDLGITHIVTAVIGVKPMYPEDFEYKCINLRDIPNEENKMAEVIPETVDYIDQKLNEDKNNKVLVHCIAGRSRSVSILIAYLMMKQGYSFDDALSLIQNKNNEANPNDGFRNLLKTLLVSEDVDKQPHNKQNCSKFKHS